MVGPHRHGRHNRHRGAPYSDPAAYSEDDGTQVPPSSSQTSFKDHSSSSPDRFPRKRKHMEPSSSYSQPPLRSPPRAPRAMRERPRTPTPPPPQLPSPVYLALAEQPPTRVEDPTSLRKLLVLDLNGTLLHRSPHVPRPKQRGYHERDAGGNVLPRLRAVHPRPYMGAFRKYVFAPETKAWLDVMVWSSAQPHSVDDMVDKCFGEDRKNMLAVWARDTLGLSSDSYFRKVQTTKDLVKPWSLLLPKVSTTDPIPSPHSSIASTHHASSSASPSPARPDGDDVDQPIPYPQPHSALTTLLLDDSPRKAELQPYNHVCIGEYTGDQRAKDLESLLKEQDWATAVEARQQLDAMKAEAEAKGEEVEVMVEEAEAKGGEAEVKDEEAGAKADDATEIPPALDAEPTAVDNPSGSPNGVVHEDPEAASTADSSKKRKRKEKKLQKRAARLEELSAGGKPVVSYDETLLAVVGVLSEIRHQANVASWIRTGGLWGARSPSSTTPPREPRADASSVDPAPPTAADAEDDSGHQSEGSDLSVKDDAGAGVDHSPKGKKRQRRRGPSADAEATGNDVETAPATTNKAEDGAEDAAQKMWFEDREVLAYWTGRGREALDALGIPAEHGLEH